MRDDVWFEYDNNLGNLNAVPTFDATIDSYEPGSKYVLGNFYDARELGRLVLGGADGADFEEYVMDEFAGANYNADETITAGYIMTTNNLGPNTILVAGFRVEKTDINYIGQVFDEDLHETPNDIAETTGEKDYTNFLPSINLRHNFSDSFNVTVAYSKSLARPDYFDLVHLNMLKMIVKELKLVIQILRLQLQTILILWQKSMWVIQESFLEVYSINH